MGLRGITTGVPEIDESVQSCGATSQWWSIRVRAKHLEGKPTLNDKDVSVSVGGGGAQTIRTSDNGFFTLEFDAGDSLVAIAIAVTYAKAHDELWTGRASPPTESGENTFVSTAHVTGHWTLEINVYDRLPADARGTRARVALPRAPIEISWDGTKRIVQTGANGETFRHNRMDCTTSYMLEVKFDGCIPEQSGWSVTGDEFQREESTTKLALKIDQPMEVVTVDFLLAFPQVFVVGEGNRFAYAIPLAKRYRGTRDDQRKWIVASQYDVDAPSEDVPNLFVYRDASDTRFDVTNESHWNRAFGRYGLFEAVIFNNPHPGYALHMCEVFGVTDQAPHAARSGKHISVHSVGHDALLTRAAADEAFEDANDQVLGRDAMMQQEYARQDDLPQVQRAFLRLIGCQRAGDDTLGDYQEDGRVARAITDLFVPLAEADKSFQERACHYNAAGTTIGLKAFLLRKYAELGLTVLLDGGELWVNGSKEFQAHIEKDDLPGFERVGKWVDNDDYYVNYAGNFTSNVFHPSYFAKSNFNPVEPPVNTAFCYRKVKE